MFEVALHRKRISKSMHSKLVSMPLLLKLKKIQGLFKDLHRNSRTFPGKMEFKDFSRTPPKIQGLLKTVRTLLQYNLTCWLVETLSPIKAFTRKKSSICPCNGKFFRLGVSWVIQLACFCGG